MGSKKEEGRSGGHKIGEVGGDFVGGDKVGGDKIGRDKVGGDKIGRDKNVGALEAALQPLVRSVQQAPAEKQTKARAKLEELKLEAAKGDKADDGVVNRLVDGFIDLVPAAASAVVGAFATPILGAIAGPITKATLDRIKGR